MVIELHGVLGERAGCGQLELAITGPVTVERVLEGVVERVPALGGDLPRVACAVGDVQVRRDEAISGEQPLVLLPPVSGG
jgi:molybdopterin converting factor small subunit